jgi:polyhydroxyalkanoate synthesis repressor PhaR
MQVIKKYANRKLYHTNRKQYITLDGIAALIQGGEQVQIIDNETGDDITAPILAQVALQGRNERTWPSTGTLADLIRAGGNTLAGVSRSLMAGLSGVSIIDAEIARRIDHLHDQGSLTAPEAARMRSLLLHSAAADPGDLPSRNDIDRLRNQVDELTLLVEQLIEEKSEPRSKN